MPYRDWTRKKRRERNQNWHRTPARAKRIVHERWARECRVLRLEPAEGEALQRPGRMPEESHAARPPASPALTRRPIPAALPKLLRRGRKG